MALYEQFGLDGSSVPHKSIQLALFFIVVLSTDFFTWFTPRSFPTSPIFSEFRYVVNIFARRTHKFEEHV